MAKVVVGLYDRIEDARDAVEALVNSGFRREDISLVASDASGDYQRYTTTDQGEDVADSAATGAGIGAVIGGLGGLLVGLGALAIPGIGPVLAAGPLVSALAGAGIGAAAGGLLGALVDLGIPEDQARVYSEGVQRGGTLVTLAASDDRAKDAVDIMNRFNPVDVNRRSQEWTTSGEYQSRETTMDMSQRTGMDTPTMDRGSDTGFDEYEPMFRSHYQTTYSGTGRTYDEFRPAYNYGYTLANDPRYRDRGWNEIEMDARRDWETRYADSPWEAVKDTIRGAWETVTGRR
jgi:hypothetical protein